MPVHSHVDVGCDNTDECESMTDRWLTMPPKTRLMSHLIPDHHAKLTGIHLGDTWGEGGSIGPVLFVVALMVAVIVIGVVLCR